MPDDPTTPPAPAPAPAPALAGRTTTTTGPDDAPLHDAPTVAALTLIADRLDHIDQRLEGAGFRRAQPDSNTGEAQVIEARTRAAWVQAIIDCPGQIGKWANNALDANPSLRVAVTGLVTATLGAAAVKAPDLIAALSALLQHKAGVSP